MELRILPPERQVSCSCDVAFQFPVLIDQTGWNDRISTCLHCGQIDLVKLIIDEPHPHDVRCVGNQLETLESAVHAWLAQWPSRIQTSWAPKEVYALLPAKLICKDEATVTSAASAELTRQSKLSFRSKILKIGFPLEAPPNDNRLPMPRFAEIWRGLTISPTAELDTIIKMTATEFSVSPFSELDMYQRSEYRNEVLRLALCRERENWSRGLELIQRHQWRTDDVMHILKQLLDGLLAQDSDVLTPQGDGTIESPKKSSEPARLLEAICDVLFELRPNTKCFAPDLKSLADRIGEKDYYLKKRCLDLAGKLAIQE